MEAPGPAPLPQQSRLSVVRRGCVHSSPECLQGWTSHCLSGPLLQCLATLVGKIKPPGEIPMTSPHVATSPHHLWQLPFATSPPQLCSITPSNGAPSSWTAPLHRPASPGASTAPCPAARLAGGQPGMQGLSGAVGCCRVLSDAARCLPAASALCVSGLTLQGLGVSGLGAEGSAEGSKGSAESGKGQTQAAGGTALEQPLITEKSIHCRQQLKA